MTASARAISPPHATVQSHHRPVPCSIATAEPDSRINLPAMQLHNHMASKFPMRKSSSRINPEHVQSRNKPVAPTQHSYSDHAPIVHVCVNSRLRCVRCDVHLPNQNDTSISLFCGIRKPVSHISVVRSKVFLRYLCSQIPQTAGMVRRIPTTILRVSGAAEHR